MTAIYTNALAWHQAGFDFGDALHLASCRQAERQKKGPATHEGAGPVP